MKVSAGLIALALPVGLVAAAPAVAAEPQRCAEYGDTGFCIEWEDAAGGSAAPAEEDDGGGSSAQVVCYWRTIDEVPATAIASGFVPEPAAGVRLVWQERVCSDGSQGDDPWANVRWAVAETISPQDLAAAARARLSGALPDPQVVTSPPLGIAAIIDVPVFVAIGNWVGDVRETECGAGLCVTVVAAPELEFRPGEPGVSTVSCAGGGTRHHPGTDTIQEAREPGACAHSFAHRTAVSGRPATWPGHATVTWAITWTASSGAAGSLPGVSRTTAVPRSVEEVQSIIVGGEVP